MNCIEIQSVGTLKPLNRKGLNLSRTSWEWCVLCKTFGFRYAGKETTLYYYDNEKTATITLSSGDIPELQAMHNTDVGAHTLYSKLIEVLEVSGCETLFVKVSVVVMDDSEKQS